ncbi:MAG: hypothetical protein P0Y65_20685 [Candidatus Devosia phytovorans]|uniref:Uncharacterized protein n=1 Tax=Candidatus Devosia phytovorans TaxID=3121372 RepID=A0AAJ5W0G7_9HYPH|nr:hypothetical protein [Devosia sp.]WEK06859.1 MAG: hypothetical protein P0Y65_20685 [Devosia sp.]
MRQSRFQALRDRSAAIVDQQFAEPVKLSFLKGGAVDQARPAVEIDAPLRVGGGKETNADGGVGRSWRTQLAAGKAELHIDRATYVGPSIKSGDAVQALSRPGQPWFEVLRVDDRGETRLVLELGEK